MKDSSPSSVRKDFDKFDSGALIAPQALKPLGPLALMAGVVGVAVGMLGVALAATTTLAVQFVFGGIGGIDTSASSTSNAWLPVWARDIPWLNFELAPSSPKLWLLILIPGVGGLLVAWWYKVVQSAPSDSTDSAIDAFHNRRGALPKGTVWKKLVASTITLGTGGSGGREGPISLMGAAIGSGVAERFRLTVRERRILLAAGLGAGVGGMFRAPIAGGLLAAEMMYSDGEFEPDVLIPAMIASATSYCVFCLNFGWGSLFASNAAESYSFNQPLELITFGMLAVILTLAIATFVWMHRLVAKSFARLPWYVRPMLGAAAAGGLTALLFVVTGSSYTQVFSCMGDGYHMLDAILGNEGVWWLLLAVGGMKIVTSTLTVGSGGAAGYFAPSIVIGGCIGGAVGLFFHQVLALDWAPVSSAGVFALVGMAGFYAGAAKAPMSTVIMVSEITGSYQTLLPAMWVCALTFIFSRHFRLYHSQVANVRESPAHRGEFATDVLKEIRVSDILDSLGNFETVYEDTSIEQVLAIKVHHQSYFPVVTRDGRFRGIFSLNDLRGVLGEQEVWGLVVAADVAHTDVVTVRPRETLADVATKFAGTSLDELPVVSDDDEHRLVGIINRRQLNNAYLRRMMEYDRADREERSQVGIASARTPDVQ